MNKKNGNIKSVGVKPCHVACNKGGYTALQVPGVFTKIINAMVKPLKISTILNINTNDFSKNRYGKRARGQWHTVRERSQRRN